MRPTERERGENPPATLPERFPASLSDRFISLLWNVGEIVVQLEMVFSHVLDRTRLRRALDSILDVEPVLGCRWIPSSPYPYWERLPLDRRENLTLLEDERAYEAYRNSPVDPRVGPALRGGLLSLPGGDRLILKFAHEATDAGGAKECAALLGKIYTTLGEGREGTQKPNIFGTRSLRSVLKRVPWHAYPRTAAEAWEDFKLFSKRAPIYNPFERGESSGCTFLFKEFSAERVRRISSAGKAVQATINDLFLTAFLRALAKARHGDPSRIVTATTVDLRKWYLPEGTPSRICNLSALEFIEMKIGLSESFSETLRRIRRIMEKKKRGLIGLNFAGWLPIAKFANHNLMTKVILHTKRNMERDRRVIPLFTNLGAIPEETLSFDGPPLLARVIPPGVYPPWLCFGLSGYKGSITLSAGTTPEACSTVESLWERMEEELPL